MKDSFDDLTARARPEGAPAAFTLLVVEGPDRGAELKIDGSEPSRPLVGQSPACALRLADRLVSRRHAALELTERGLRVADLSSTNGTFVNGLRVESAFLKGGEIVRVGETSLRVEARGEPAPSSTSNAMRFGRVIGGSPEMRRLYPLCERIAQSTMPVLIEGETGTGKEMLAEALHECGPRANGPFVVFDCTAVPPNLLESTLFGHEKGAYTGAVAARKGVFEQAHGGTLLIDEIGDLELALQSKLLRAIERSEVQRVGGTGFVRCDARVLCATRRDLDREVAAGRFRDDLYFRITVARVELPPLRQRTGDIELLCAHFWRALGGDGPVPSELLQRAQDYPWPGNVRELYNAVVRWRALGTLGLSDAPAQPAAPQPSPQPPILARDVIDEVLALALPFPASRDRVMSEFERRYVERVLALHGGSVARAAEASGIARRYFQIIRARQAK
jgi:DNA-binding NtrC family response regulator